MKVKIIFILILFFASCKKQDQPGFTSAKTPYLSHIYLNNNIYKKYFYNDAWQLVAIHNYKDSNNYSIDSIYYNTENKISKYKQFANSRLAYREHVYEYTGNGNILKEKYFEPYRDTLIGTYYFEYFYDPDNRPSFKTQYSSADKANVLSYSYTYDQRGNLIKFVDFVHVNGSNTPSPGLYQYFKYDDYKNATLWFDCNYYAHDMIPVVNNITKATYVMNNDTLSRSYDAVFTYSPEKVPLTEIRTTKDSKVQRLTYNYIYK